MPAKKIANKEAKVKIKLRPLIEYIYTWAKELFKKIVDKLDLIRNPDILPKRLKLQEQKDTRSRYLKIKKPGDILLAAAIVRTKKIALRFFWGDNTNPSKDTEFHSASSGAIQLYGLFGRAGGSYKVLSNKVQDLLYVREAKEEAKILAAAKAKAEVAVKAKLKDIKKKDKSKIKKEAKAHALAEAKAKAEAKAIKDKEAENKEEAQKQAETKMSEELVKIIDGEADSRALKCHLDLSLVMAVCETVRDPAMLIFLYLALNNIKYNEVSFKDTFNGGKDAYPPTQTGVAISETLNSLAEAKDVDKVYTILNKNTFLKHQMERQLGRFLNNREEEGIKFSCEISSEAKSEAKLFVTTSKRYKDDAALTDIATEKAKEILKSKIFDNIQVDDSDTEYDAKDIKEEKARLQRL